MYERTPSFAFYFSVDSFMEFVQTSQALWVLRRSLIRDKSKGLRVLKRFDALIAGKLTISHFSVLFRSHNNNSARTPQQHNRPNGHLNHASEPSGRGVRGGAHDNVAQVHHAPRRQQDFSPPQNAHFLAANQASSPTIPSTSPFHYMQQQAQQQQVSNHHRINAISSPTRGSSYKESHQSPAGLSPR